MTLISVVITAKNEAPVLDKVIDNLIKELSNFDYEMILVDNYSTDNTFEILKKYESDNIKVFRYNGSKGSTRNYALKQSSGKYVMALDADQIYKNLEKFLKDYLSNYSSYSVKIGRSSFPIIASRDLLLKVGGWRDLQFAEDWDLWFRLSDMCKYLYLPGYDWVLGDHLRSHKNNSNVIKRMIKNIIRYRDLNIVGLPIHKTGLSHEVFYYIGKLLSLSKKDLKINYKCTKYLEQPVPININKKIDWDLQFHYNLLRYEYQTCSEKNIFSRLLKFLENYLLNA